MFLILCANFAEKIYTHISVKMYRFVISRNPHLITVYKSSFNTMTLKPDYYNNHYPNINFNYSAYIRS